MKTKKIIPTIVRLQAATLTLSIFVYGSFGADHKPASTATSPTADPLVGEYDVNQNGKIDIGERRGYVRALGRQRREQAKQLAAERPHLTPQESQFYRLPRLNLDVLHKYDTNYDGKLDSAERINMHIEAAEAARHEFRRHDANSDGRLDAQERKGINVSGLGQEFVQDKPNRKPATRTEKPNSGVMGPTYNRNSPTANHW